MGLPGNGGAVSAVIDDWRHSYPTGSDQCMGGGGGGVPLGAALGVPGCINAWCGARQIACSPQVGGGGGGERRPPIWRAPSRRGGTSTPSLYPGFTGERFDSTGSAMLPANEAVPQCTAAVSGTCLRECVHAGRARSLNMGVDSTLHYGTVPQAVPSSEL